MTVTNKPMATGKAAEHFVCCELLLAGYEAFLSAQALPFDVVADIDGKLLRIQVKSTLSPRIVTAQGRPARQAYAVTTFRRRTLKGHLITRGLVTTAEHCDLVAFVALDIRVIAWFPVEHLSASLQLGIPGTGKTTKGRKPLGTIDQFPLEAAISGDPKLYSRKRETCSRGHPFEKPHVRYDGGERYCATCKRASANPARRKRRALKNLSSTGPTEERDIVPWAVSSRRPSS